MIATVYLQINYLPSIPTLSKHMDEVESKTRRKPAPVFLGYSVTVLEGISRNSLLWGIVFEHLRQVSVYIVLKDF